jgi:glycosyltransferase involved in cell wall biosynthesis
MSVQIIMPNFNGGKYIAEAIDSVLAQTRSDWQLYIMDGGSTDNSLDIIQSVKDSRIFWRKDKLNFPDRFNLASTYSKSPYISYLASDDKFYPTFLEENLRVLNGDRSIDFVYNSYVEARDNILKMHPHVQYEKNLLLRCFYMGVFWVFKRSIFDEVNGTRNVPAFDYDMCLRMEEAGANFKYLDKFLGWYRIHSESDTGSHSREWLLQIGKDVQDLAKKRRGLC